MTNILLAVIITSTGLTKVQVPPTDPMHMYYMSTSTNMAAGWDNTDGSLFYGSDLPLVYYQYPPRPQEFFKLVDLGEW